MNLRDQLIRHEGERLSAYQDHLGFWTIGVGRLIDARRGGGISHAEAMYLLDNDIARRKVALSQTLPWMANLEEPRRAALLNMSFQLGVDGVLKFKNTLAAIQAKNWIAAGAGMRASLWAHQTPERADELARQIETGEWQQ